MPETKSVTYKDGPFRSIRIDGIDIARGASGDLTAAQVKRLRDSDPRVQLDDGSKPATTTKPKEGSSS